MAGTSGPNTRPKLFIKALNRAIAQDSADRLRQCAERLLDLAAAGEAWAVKELADRLDGKPIQDTSVELIDRRAVDVDDDTLVHIATGSGNRTSEAQDSPQVTH